MIYLIAFIHICGYIKRKPSNSEAPFGVKLLIGEASITVSLFGMESQFESPSISEAPLKERSRFLNKKKV